jgi:hypothetical protein
MAWSVPLTAVSGAALTDSQWNASVRDNLLTTFPALATTAGQIAVATGANAIAARTCPADIVSAAEAVVATSYGNISGGTVGPTINTLTTGASVMVVLACQLSNTTGGAASYMSYTISGATTQSAADATALYYESSNAGDLIGMGITIPNSVTSGSNTFQAKYKVGAGTGTFGSRRLAILNFGQ